MSTESHALCWNSKVLFMCGNDYIDSLYLRNSLLGEKR